MTFAELTAQFVGKPYSEYGKGPDSYGCLGLVYAFAKAAGKPIDESVWQFQGFSIDNFMEDWKQNPRKLEQIMIDAAERVGVEVSINKKLAGDLVILRAANGGCFPGIYVGNSHCMASYWNAGVRVFQIDNKDITVIKVRRL